MRGRKRHRKKLFKQALTSLRGCHEELGKLRAVLDRSIKQKRDFADWLEAFNDKLERRASPFKSKSPLLN